MVFANLTVMENLRMALPASDKAGIAKDLEYIFGIFPRLKERECRPLERQRRRQQSSPSAGRS